MFAMFENASSCINTPVMRIIELQRKLLVAKRVLFAAIVNPFSLTCERRSFRVTVGFAFGRSYINYNREWSWLYSWKWIKVCATICISYSVARISVPNREQLSLDLLFPSCGMLPASLRLRFEAFSHATFWSFEPDRYPKDVLQNLWIPAPISGSLRSDLQNLWILAPVTFS